MNANFRASHLMAGVIAAAFMLGVTQSASAGPDVWPAGYCPTRAVNS
jgi:hypothetical protein